MGLQADSRAAAVDLMRDYAASVALKMNVYPARPRQITAPHAFVDGIREALDHGSNLTERRTFVDVIVIHAIYDSMEAADQKDAFMDGFIPWCESQFHAAGANTMLGLSDSEDLPNYVPEWMPEEQRRVVYYATRLVLEVFSRGA